MAVIADLDLVDEILGVCEKHGARLYLPDPPFDDLVNMHAEAHIIDRWYMGKNVWNVYCDRLNGPAAGRGQVSAAGDGDGAVDGGHATAGGGQAATSDGQAQVSGGHVSTEGGRAAAREGQASLLNGSVMDTTPLIITDWRMDRSVLEFRSPNKPADAVFMVEGGAKDIVTLIVKKILQGEKHIDFAEVIEEVNAERLAGR